MRKKSQTHFQEQLATNIRFQGQLAYNTRPQEQLANNTHSQEQLVYYNIQDSILTHEEISTHNYDLQDNDNDVSDHNYGHEDSDSNVSTYDNDLQDSDSDISANNDSSDQDNDDFFQNSNVDNPNINNGSQKVADESASFDPFDGNYGPYFANYTEQMLFLWITKHMICELFLQTIFVLCKASFYINFFQATSAYKDLMAIIKHPLFQSQHATSNIRHLRSLRTRLPLLPIRSHPILIDDRKTPSTSNPIKLAYTISIREHLNHILNNPRIMEKMYFGRGIESCEKLELWHGDIWQRSPLYGDTTIVINNGKTFLLNNRKIF